MEDDVTIIVVEEVTDIVFNITEEGDDVVIIVDDSNMIKKAYWQDPYSYHGKADIGTAEDEAGWFITRIEIAEDGSVTEELTAAGVKWTDHLTVIYT